MVTNDKSQSHKQFVQRRQRVKVADTYDSRINLVENEIEDIDKEIERLNEHKKEKQNELNKITDEKFHDLMRQYNNEKLLEEIFSLGKETTFSHNIIDELANKYSNNINEDNATQADIDTIVTIEKAINKDVPHTNIVMDILASVGRNIEIGKGEGESNEN